VSAGIGVLVGVLVYIIGSVVAIKLAKLDAKEAANELFLGNVESLREDLNKVVTTTGKPPTPLCSSHFCSLCFLLHICTTTIIPL
jgi:hypothetical protein